MKVDELESSHETVFRAAVLSLLPVALALSSLACATSTIEGPDLGGLYSRAAKEGDDDRNPIVVIPGILGSRLADGQTGQAVWGVFDGEYADPGTPLGARLISHPMGLGENLADLRDQVVADGALDRLEISLFGLPLLVNAYAHILGSLGVGGYRDQQILMGGVDFGEEHFTCFQFAYDWRRDISENARRLHEFLVDRGKYVRERRTELSGDDRPVRFDIVAHSMGGLLLRYYLRYGTDELSEDMPEIEWKGTELVERAVLVGTPNAGSLEAAVQLTEGYDILPFFSAYSPAILGTMPAIYQLLPRVRHRQIRYHGREETVFRDLYDVEAWDARGWGLLDPEEGDVLAWLLPDIGDVAERRRVAKDHVRKCLDAARKLHAALDRPAELPDGLDLILIAGDAVPTMGRLGLDETTQRFEVLEEIPGDGTVTRASALLDERLDGEWTPRLRTPIHWSRVLFLFSDHLGLTSDPGFTDNLLYFLLEEPRP